LPRKPRSASGAIGRSPKPRLPSTRPSANMMPGRRHRSGA
jgi:hypothetical protein